MDKILEVRELCIQYRTGNADAHDAVSRVSLEVGEAEVVGLMGESGCGKSSIALALLGLLDKRKAQVCGSILFRSQELLSMSERRLQQIRGAGISIVFQDPGIALCPVRRVGDQIAEIIHAHSRSNWKQCRMEAEAMLDRVGLPETGRIFRAYPHQLSGGQRQRIALAQALVCGPELLIADEPTASLDTRSQTGFIKLLKELKSKRRISILLISHTPEIQASLSDRLLIMKGGEIVESGGFEDIYEHPCHPYTRLLFGKRQRLPSGDIDPETEILMLERAVR